MIKTLRQKLKNFALADAIISPNWESRYFSYNGKWSAAEEVASLRDGCGGEWFLWLSANLAAYKCLSPEDGLMADLENAKTKIPTDYDSFITDPAFSMDRATCIWYWEDSSWQKQGLSVEYLIDLEAIIKWTTKDYHAWATDYYEREIDIKALDNLFETTFSEETALKLNSEVDMSELRKELMEMGINS